jgi:NADH dehydrogenase/NADH:ubiquinone oxidoreductase subunit G
VGRLQGDELERFVEGYDRGGRVAPAEGNTAGFSREEADREAGRCLHCECLKAGSCKLRLYADAYGARQESYLHRVRATYSRVLQHADVIFEPGKCIKCGLCVRIAEKHGGPLGLTFIDRGFDLRVDVPFQDSMADGLRGIAEECVEACPTAALSFKSDSLRRKRHDD